MFNNHSLCNKMKVLAILIFSISITIIFNLQIVSAKSKGDCGCGDDKCVLVSEIKLVETHEENNEIVTTFNDGSIVTENKDGSIDLIIPLSSSFFCR